LGDVGEEAARCAFLRCGGTYADFVPLMPREAVRTTELVGRPDRNEHVNERNAPNCFSISEAFTIPLVILERESCFFFESSEREKRRLKKPMVVVAKVEEMGRRSSQ